ncbi:transcriptional regulator [Deinococcus cavernae]|uniref:transcriptional regulator n=1 Tax=Deinococcus cavernae TaxID=2320857 RepID=UPI0018F71C2B|nr:transcriptional regulator [Deinococcus cavernae]
MPSALATDADDLLRALQKARAWEARGQVQVTVLFPPRDVPTKMMGKLPVLPLRPGAVVKAFTVVKAGSETLAGRAVTRFELTPLNVGAARWRLWVDDAWNVPLGFEERGADGALARQALFQKVNARLVKGQGPSLSVASGLRAAVQGAVPGLRVPAGFTPVSVQQKDRRVEVTLSDGLNTLALVLAPRNVKAAPGVASRQVGGRFVWLVGNLPQEALKAALSQVRRVDESALGTFLAPAASKP